MPDAHWHLVGPLQSNKARRAVELFDVDPVGRLGRARARLDRLGRRGRPGDALPVLLQVNVDDDPAKAGFAVARSRATCPRSRLRTFASTA